MFVRIGRFCVRHHRSVLLAWALVLVAGIGLGSQVFAHLTESNGSSRAESVRGFQLVDDASRHGPGLVAVVDGAAVDDPATRRAVTAAAREVSRVDGVTGVVTAYDVADPRLRADDGRASLMVISTTKTTDMMRSDQILTGVRAAVSGAVPGATVTVGGELAVLHEQMTAAQHDLVRGEMLALPILLLALLLVFRGFRAAVLPIVAALVTVAGALLLLLSVSGAVDLAGYAVDVVALFGLALSVDYSLLMVTRFREERAAGHGADDAVVRTVTAAGRTIAFSALTVIAALGGLFVFADPTFTSLAIGGIATTVLALLAGLFLVPALLAGWGRTISPQAQPATASGAFGRLARRVQRRPVAVVTVCILGLLVLATPFLSVNYGQGDPRLLPRAFDSRVVADLLSARFPGTQADPIQVVAQRPADDPAVVAYASRLRTLPGVAAVSIDGSAGPHLSVTEVVPVGGTQGAVARRLVGTIRAQRPDHPTLVTGRAAFLIDFKANIAHRLPWAIGLIALATFTLLFLMTGSVLVPVKALVMNTLSLGATFGALVFVFQDGHFSGVLGFDAFGAIEVWAPVVVFVFAFGLSMDYEVFLLSRIKEHYDETGDNDDAVALGLQRSGRIITSAAALVMIVFLGFALGQDLGIKQMGLALAVAVAVDATIVRCLLVPATMTLLGDGNWWAPPLLRRLYARFGLREGAASIVPTGGIPADRSVRHRQPAAELVPPERGPVPAGQPR